MIINPDDKIFDEMFYWMFIRRGDLKGKNFNCYLSSAILGYYFSEIKGTVYIIETNFHSVVFDGRSTWDLNLGIMFKDYKYPNKNLPKYTKIPKFYRFFTQHMYDNYYSPETLLKSIDNVSLKTIIN